MHVDVQCKLGEATLAGLPPVFVAIFCPSGYAGNGGVQPIEAPRARAACIARCLTRSSA